MLILCLYFYVTPVQIQCPSPYINQALLLYFFLKKVNLCLPMLPWNEVCILFPSIHLLVSLFPVICFELPITGTFFNFPKRSVVGHRSGGAGGASVPPPPRHFCRIINNFLIFYHGQLLKTKNTILESSSKRRLVCLKEETRYLAGWIGTCHFFIRTRSLTPSPLCGRLSSVVLLSAPLKIAS